MGEPCKTLLKRQCYNIQTTHYGFSKERGNCIVGRGAKPLCCFPTLKRKQKQDDMHSGMSGGVCGEHVRKALQIHPLKEELGTLACRGVNLSFYTRPLFSLGPGFTICYGYGEIGGEEIIIPLQ